MTDFDVTPWLQNKDLLHQALLDSGSTCKNGKYSCPHPGHEDKHPSCSIYHHNNKYKWKCHSCGAGGDLIDLESITTGRTVEEVIIDWKEKHGNSGPPSVPPTRTAPPEKKKKTYPDLDAVVNAAEFVTKGTCVKRHTYTDPDSGHADLVVLRIEKPEGKEFFPVYSTGNGWQMGQPEGPRPLYNRGRIRNTQSVLVVEGEKCVEAAHAVGIVATTSPGGSRAATKADWSPLAGKTVVIWRDNDERKAKDEPSAGEVYQADVINCLAALRPSPIIKVIDVAALNLAPKDDIADFIARERAENVSPTVIRDVIQDMMDEAKPYGASAGLFQRIEDTISGRIESIPWPFPQLSNLTRAIQPGTVTILCGDPGSAKSFLLLQCLMHWHLEGVRVAVLELEDDKNFHLQRALCHLEEFNGHFDMNWIQQHPEEAREAYRKHQHTLDTFAVCMDDDPDMEMTLPKLAAWVNWRCQQGARILAIDPITIVDTGSEPWNTERQFMAEVKRTLRHHGASLILVTHPKKNRQNAINLDQLAGSTAFPRFTHTILWLEHLREDEEMDIIRLKQSFGAPQKEVVQVRCNKRLHLCKTRLGSGHGLKMAYHLTGKSMLMHEQGIITKTVHKN